MDISENLRAIRTACNLTQQQVADRLFVTRQTVTRWESGKVNPPLAALEDLADVYGVSIAELLGASQMTITTINFAALFGVLVFNLLVGISVAAVVASLLFAAWICVVAFVLSPLMVVGAAVAGIQAFSWIQFGLGVLLMIGGLVATPFLLKLTTFLGRMFKAYCRYTVSTVTYTVVEPASARSGAVLDLQNR